MKGKSKEWLKKLMVVPTDWWTMKATMLLKYGTVDKEEVRAKLDLIKQELKQRVRAYYDKLEKLFTRGKLEDGEQRKRFLSRPRLEIKKMCVMRNHGNMEDLFNAALEVERVLEKLGKTLFELLKEEEEDMVVGENAVEKQVQLLNGSLINLLRRHIEMQTKPKYMHGVAISVNEC
jgi:hypothetical protein